jgi:hypothetical protein
MASALDLSSDVSTASAALAGLLLVFMGSISASYQSIDPAIQSVVVGRYRLRIWFAFAGFALAIGATFFALLGKWEQNEHACLLAALLLFGAMAWAIAAAVRAALDVQ